MIKSFAKIFLMVDLGLILIGAIFYDYTWMLNTQFAFVSSLFITLATFYSYKRNVQRRLDGIEGEAAKGEDRDKIDEIDDPFDLYSDDEINEKEDLTKEEIQTIIKEEKAKVKQKSFRNTLTSGTSFMSIYRIGGYTVLILGLLYLTNHQQFEAIPYLLGLTIVPVSMLLSKFVIKE